MKYGPEEEREYNEFIRKRRQYVRFVTRQPATPAEKLEASRGGPHILEKPAKENFQTLKNNQKRRNDELAPLRRSTQPSRPYNKKRKIELTSINKEKSKMTTTISNSMPIINNHVPTASASHTHAPKTMDGATSDDNNHSRSWRPWEMQAKLDQFIPSISSSSSSSFSSSSERVGLNSTGVVPTEKETTRLETPVEHESSRNQPASIKSNHEEDQVPDKKKNDNAESTKSACSVKSTLLDRDALSIIYSEYEVERPKDPNYNL
ncbi:hypothetical protein ACJMK2_008762 [Sinanodonta woodiana]|uniref:Uncharacterized protein n=1 Tax=Sinanodonta woodiana TaxID=1069815 RepID=A0ABD3VNB1_SINWO